MDLRTYHHMDRQGKSVTSVSSVETLVTSASDLKIPYKNSKQLQTTHFSIIFLSLLSKNNDISLRNRSSLLMTSPEERKRAAASTVFSDDHPSQHQSSNTNPNLFCPRITNPALKQTKNYPKPHIGSFGTKTLT